MVGWSQLSCLPRSQHLFKYTHTHNIYHKPNNNPRLEAEKDFITQQTVNMRERMGRAFCTAKAKSPPLRSFDTKSASLPTPEPGTGRLRRRKLTVDVLAEDDAVAVYHLKGFLDKNATRALLLNAPSVEERHAAMTPAPGFKPDAALVEVARWAEDFVAAELESLEGEKKEERRRFRPSAALGVEAVVRGEPLHFFRHDDNGIHACVSRALSLCL